jgi:outer membrane receptor protein involved in Fe transport
LPSYTTLDISAGFRKDDWMIDVYVANVTDERGELSHFTQCAESVCGAAGVVPQYPNGQIYTLTNQPRSFGIRFSQSF